mgnify:CR=1 FL=1
MNPEQIVRFRRDFYTNPVFGEVMDAFAEQLRREEVTLKGISKTGELSKINAQAGVVDGIERNLKLLTNMRDEALEPKRES